MATHSSILTWRIPWTEKPGRVPSMALQRVGHDWSNLTLICALYSLKPKMEKVYTVSKNKTGS